MSLAFHGLLTPRPLQSSHTGPPAGPACATLLPASGSSRVLPEGSLPRGWLPHVLPFYSKATFPQGAFGAFLMKTLSPLPSKPLSRRVFPVAEVAGTQDTLSVVLCWRLRLVLQQKTRRGRGFPAPLHWRPPAGNGSLHTVGSHQRLRD